MRLLGEAWLDIRFAARTYRRAPGFAAAAFVTLVVGIAAVTSIFSYINAVYFAALPYKDANRIVALSEIRPREFGTFSDVSRDVVQLVRRGARSFERVSAYSTGGGTVLFGTEPSSLRTLLVDSAFVPLLDLQPQIGRVIMPEDIAANAAVMAEKSREYVVAAKVAGAGHLRLMLATILPNCLAPLIVQGTLSFSNAILEAAALGFLGLGAQPPTPEWGTMLASAREFILRAWWVVTFPGLAILITVLAINLIGDGLRDALDPKLRRS